MIDRCALKPGHTTEHVVDSVDIYKEVIENGHSGKGCILYLSRNDSLFYQEADRCVS